MLGAGRMTVTAPLLREASTWLSDPWACAQCGEALPKDGIFRFRCYGCVWPILNKRIFEGIEESAMRRARMKEKKR